MKLKLTIARLAILFFVMSAPLHAKDKVNINEEVIEGKPDTFFIGKTLEGTMRIKACDSCDDLKLRITPDVKAFLEGKPVLLRDVAKRSDKPLVVFYDSKTKLVTKLHWFTK
ncbi:MAG: hypothetical protein OQK76_08980 [Gammaproteobacteria bacterium]|nr:hypothetical protein [Gammaproteobacteria bacterium]MCW8910735.1 hypothetical protein [Gammaproteobacteria bacterium]MCW9004261.1 hypothetical protein [Gammaproteobacteria bacterium]MCW9055420.1 hypothetical protein [Gammaproteobacteria bacterium]